MSTDGHGGIDIRIKLCRRFGLLGKNQQHATSSPARLLAHWRAKKCASGGPSAARTITASFLLAVAVSDKLRLDESSNNSPKDRYDYKKSSAMSAKKHPPQATCSPQPIAPDTPHICSRLWQIQEIGAKASGGIVISTRI